jgi:hypothetical protein
MSDELTDLRTRINLKIHEIHSLTYNIKELDTIITNNDLENISEEEARNRMKDVIDDYKRSVDKARILLECYFKEEAKLGKPSDFLLRRLYSKLGQAY